MRPRMLEENRFSAVDTVSHARELYGGVDVRNAVIPRDLGGPSGDTLLRTAVPRLPRLANLLMLFLGWRGSQNWQE